MPRADTTAAAHALLDAARAGEDVPEWKITAALVETGDLFDEDQPTHRVMHAGEWESQAPNRTPATWLSGLQVV